jgi:uncharacterized membrane protein
MTYLEQFNIIDIFAMIWFLILWTGYSLFADLHKSKNLVSAMHKYRIRWMKAMVRREDRLVDIRILANLIQSSTFFASTSILIIGGMFALLGYGERALKIMSVIPFATQMELHMWIVKTMFLIVIFIFAFFKFTWVIRQYNYAIVLIISTKRYYDNSTSKEDVKSAAKSIVQIAKIISNSSMHFNKGMRSYYFALVALSWYISPILLIILSVLVVLVLYRREFLSKTLKMLT